MQLHSEFKQLAQSVAREGGRLFVVGGAVRDHLLGMLARDVDLLLVGPGRRVFEEREGELVPGVFGASIGGQFIEVKEARQLSLDLGSRDFTVNAMAWDILNGTLHDPFDGRAHLAARELVPIGVKCFTNSPERVFRLAALASRFGLNPNRSIPLAQALSPDALASVPDEQRFRQLERMARGWRVASGLWALNALGISNCDPELVEEMANRLRRQRTERVPVVFAMAKLPLGGGTRELRVQVEKLLKWAPAPIETVGEARAVADELEPLSVHALAAVKCTSVFARAEAQVLERLADNAGVPFGPLPWLVRGADAIGAGVSEGPEVGRVLLAIREAQFHDVVRTREAALQLAGQGGWNADGVRRFAGLGVDGH